MKLIYFTIILIVAILFAVSDVDAHKKHKHHGHQHVYHHHYYHGGHDHGHGWGHRYRREVIDIKPEESKGPLLDKLTVGTNSQTEELLEKHVPEEKKPLNNGAAAAIAKETIKDATAEKAVKVDEKVQNVASFAL